MNKANTLRQLRDLVKEIKTELKEARDHAKSALDAEGGQPGPWTRGYEQQYCEIGATYAYAQHRLRAEGGRLGYEEDLEKRAKANQANLNYSGMARDRFEMLANKTLQSNTAKAILESPSLNTATGDLGKRLVAASSEGGLPAALGEVKAFTGAVGSSVAAFTALPAAIMAGAAVFDPWSEARRHYAQDFIVEQAQAVSSRGADPYKNSLMIREQQRSELAFTSQGRAIAGAQWAANQIGSIPLVGGLVAAPLHIGIDIWDSLRARRYGLDEATMAAQKTEVAARQAGVGANISEDRNLAMQRAYAERYGSALGGFIMQNTWGAIKSLWGSNEDEGAASRKVGEMYQKFEAFQQQGDNAAARGDFDAASASYSQGNRELPDRLHWRNPLEIWKESNNAIVAARVWGLTQMACPPVREGF